jgi:hypothetical protein
MGLGQIDLFLSANALTNLISLAIVPASSSKKEQAHAEEDVMLASPNFGGHELSWGSGSVCLANISLTQREASGHLSNK